MYFLICIYVYIYEKRERERERIWVKGICVFLYYSWSFSVIKLFPNKKFQK